MLGASSRHRESVLGAGAPQQVPTRLVQPLPPQPIPPGFLDSQTLSPPAPQPVGPRGALCVAHKRRAICFHQTLFLSPLTTPLAPQPKSTSHLETPHLCKNQPLSPSSRCPPPFLNFSFFFFCWAQVIVRRRGKALEDSVPSAPQQFSEGHKEPR